MELATTGDLKLLVKAGLKASVPNRERRDGCIPWKDRGRIDIDGVNWDE